jgi:hypothetical protein
LPELFRTAGTMLEKVFPATNFCLAWPAGLLL